MPKDYDYGGIGNYYFNNPPDSRCTSCRYFKEYNSRDYMYKCTASTGSKAALLAKNESANAKCGDYEKLEEGSAQIKFRGKNKVLNTMFGMLCNGCNELFCKQGSLLDKDSGNLERQLCGISKIFIGLLIPVFIGAFFLIKYLFIGIFKLIKLIIQAIRKKKTENIASNSINGQNNTE